MEYLNRHNTSFATKCDLCGTKRNFFYSANIGGMNYKFCSGSHYQRAKDNFDINKDSIQSIPSAVDDAMIDFEQGVDDASE